VLTCGRLEGGRKMAKTPYEPVPNFQCPRCGKMSVVRGRFRADGSSAILLGEYKYKCLACEFLFGSVVR